MEVDEPVVVNSNERRPYFRLSFGPNYVGWFDTIESIHEGVPRLWKQLEADGVVEFVEVNGRRILKEKPKHEMRAETVEMTPAEYQAIPCVYPSWISGGTT